MTLRPEDIQSSDEIYLHEHFEAWRTKLEEQSLAARHGWHNELVRLREQLAATHAVVENVAGRNEGTEGHDAEQ